MAEHFLTGQAAQVQLEGGNWDGRPLESDMPSAQASDAALRTRRNLFHGGKQATPYSADGRDEAKCAQQWSFLASASRQPRP